VVHPHLFGQAVTSYENFPLIIKECRQFPFTMSKEQKCTSVCGAFQFCCYQAKSVTRAHRGNIWTYFRRFRVDVAFNSMALVPTPWHTMYISWWTTWQSTKFSPSTSVSCSSSHSAKHSIPRLNSGRGNRPLAVPWPYSVLPAHAKNGESLQQCAFANTCVGRSRSSALHTMRFSVSCW
jgi:hypothetical protein